jgi:hypothetical protein
LRDLANLIRTKPTHSEVEDKQGKHLSGQQAIYERFKHDGVSDKLARVLHWDFMVHNQLKTLANLRTTFILIIDGLIALCAAAIIRYPGLLGYITFVITRGDTTRTMLGMTPSENLPQWVLSTFLYVLVLAFFSAAFKAIVEPIAGNIFDIPAIGLWMFGQIPKRKAEFTKLTTLDSDEFLRRHYESKPLEKEGDLREPLLQFAAMFNKRVPKVLENPDIDITIKREIVSCLYRYAAHPLHINLEFFKFDNLILPTDEEVMHEMPKGIHLRPAEIEILFQDENKSYVEALKTDLGLRRFGRKSLERLSPDQDVVLAESLRNSKFSLLDDWLRDRVDERRISLVAVAIREYPMPVLLALISEDLAGWGFYLNDREQQQQGDELEEMRQVLRATVDRMSTLDPELYVRYREFLRYHNQWEGISLCIGAIREKNAQLCQIMYDHFSQGLSEIDVDPTNPMVFRTLELRQKVVVAVVKFILSPMTWMSPETSLWIKKKVPGFVRVLKDPQEQLQLCLLFKGIDIHMHDLNAKPAKGVRPKEEAPRDLAINLLDQILHFRLFGIKNADGNIDEVQLQKFFEQTDFKPIRHLAERNGIDIESVIRAYLSSQDTPEARNVLGGLYDQLNLGSGNRNSLVKQYFRREDKSDADESEKLLERLLGGRRVADPARPPIYMATQYLSDENMKPTTSAAALEQADSEAKELLDELIASRPPGGPAPFGNIEIVREAALAETRQRTLEDFKRDQLLTNGDINLVSISRGLLGFMFEIFNRIRSRLSSEYSRRIWPLFIHQIRPILRRASNHRRLILTSPETHSLARWLDPTFKDADVIVTPSPYLTSAAKILAFMNMMPAEKEAYFEAVRDAYGEAKAASLENKLTNYVNLLRSFHLEIALYTQRYERDETTGKIIDKLERKLPPFSYRTFAMMPEGSLQMPEDPESPSTRAVLSGPRSWFRRIWRARRRRIQVLSLDGSA